MRTLSSHMKAIQLGSVMKSEEKDDHLRDSGVNIDFNPLLSTRLLNVITDLPLDIFHLELGRYRMFFFPDFACTSPWLLL
jgi:hypothetical protein